MPIVKEEFLQPKFGLWWDYFKEFYEKEGFDPIYNRLKKDSQRGIIICPDSDKTYRSFEVTNPKNLKIIWVLLDPYASVYNGIKTADGVAMSCESRMIIQPSLQKFYNSISQSEENDELETPYSLQYLIDQGNMFYNTALTVPKDKTGAHLPLWNDFMKYFYEEVMSHFSGIIYVLCGGDSQKMEKYINPLGNYIFKLEHPSFANRQQRDWLYDDIFNKINFILKGNQGEAAQIEWDFKKYTDQVPF